MRQAKEIRVCTIPIYIVSIHGWTRELILLAAKKLNALNTFAEIDMKIANMCLFANIRIESALKYFARISESKSSGFEMRSTPI